MIIHWHAILTSKFLLCLLIEEQMTVTCRVFFVVNFVLGRVKSNGKLIHFLKYKAGIFVSKIRSATNQSHKSESLYCNQMKSSNYIMFDICRHLHNPSRQNKYKRWALSFRCTKIVHRLHNDSIFSHSWSVPTLEVELHC